LDSQLEDNVPAGFELVDTGTGFNEHFGPVYLDRQRKALAFRAASRHSNIQNVCHGGAIATFADMQILAVLSCFAPGDVHRPTIHLALDYLAPTPLGAWIEALVTIVKTTPNLVFTQAMITADGKSVARTSAIYRNYVTGGS
jgi:acyl-coenzyme A thioesterase PaaI-like protein